MNQLPGSSIATEQVTAFAVFPAGLLLLFLFLGFSFAIALVRRRTGLRTSRKVHRLQYAGEATWLLAPLIVASTFAAISAMESTSSGLAGQAKSAPLRQSAVKEDLAPPKSLAAGLPALDRGATLTTPRPAWINQAKIVDGDCQHIVLSSQQYSTREEAEAELSEIATELLREDLRKLRPSMPASSWRPSSSDLQRLVVKQYYVEVVERDFGSFFHPMYRVWWQIELSPEVRTEFLPAWRHSLTNTRVRGLGLAVSSLVVVVSLLALYRRLDVMTEGTRCWELAFIAGLISLAWLMAVGIARNHWV